MTQQQLDQIDDLFRIRKRLSAREWKFLDACGQASANDPAVVMADKAAKQLAAMHQKHANRIRIAKQKSYALRPSGVKQL